MAEIDLSTAFNMTPSLLEQLGKALIELQSHKDGAVDVVSFTEISEHFRDLEARMMQKYTELEAREKTFKQEESDGLTLLAAKEAAVAAKEQDMFDRIQVLKDAAVAAIAEARAKAGDDNLDVTGTEDKVNCSFGEVTFGQELAQFCERMDGRGLLNFVIENRKHITVICEELSVALNSCTDPGRLILDSLEGFFPRDETTQEGTSLKDYNAVQGMRQSCINLMESMHAMLAKADLGGDHLLSLEIKQQAKAVADEWRPKLAHYGITDAAIGKSLEAKAFLQLLATFRITSQFDEDDLCKLVLAVCERRQAPELCRSLGLSHKMPVIIEELISNGKLIRAVHFVHAFELADRFPTVPLLKTYLKDARRNSQGGTECSQNEGNAKELAALRAVIYCVQKYDLEAEYPLDQLHKRVGQLERAKSEKKRPLPREPPAKPSPSKKSRSKGPGPPVYGHRSPAAAFNGRQAPAPAPALAPVYMDRGPYAAPSADGYPYAALNDPYNYQAAHPTSQTTYGQQVYQAAPTTSQATYSQQVYEQSAYYYPTEDSATPAAAPPAYGGYTSSGVPSSYQPYM